jgi:hypothetical protein
MPAAGERRSNMDQIMMAYPSILKLTSKFVTAQNGFLPFREVTISASENAKFAVAKIGRHG